MLVIAITEDSMEAPQKLKTELPYDPEIHFTFRYIPKRN